MGYVKKVKSAQYFKRYQTKFRRRREAKTDYYARKRMVQQDVNKLGTIKYRLVVRFTNQRCITQIVHATLEGDRILCHADSFELKRFGLTCGLTNYASSYATGLLLARRLLTQIGLADMYKGTETIDGKAYDVAALAETFANDRRPFKAILDIGLARSTVGNRVYAVLKGACDGGLHVPHNTRNFAGATCTKDDRKRVFKYDPEVHRMRIFGLHVDEYIEKMEEENKEKADKMFRRWNECLEANGTDDISKVYEKVFAAIRADPKRVKKPARESKPQTYEDEAKTIIVTKKGKYLRNRKKTLAQRKADVQMKIAIFEEEMQE